MRKLVLFAGIPLLVFGLVLHGIFNSQDSTYHESFSTKQPCKISLSKITETPNFAELGCPSQIILLEANFVKLFLGLGVLLTGSGLFLIYSGIDKK